MPVIVPVTGSTVKLAQLTGERDRQLGRPTPNATDSRFALIGTDLGASFEHGGKTWFLFGDTSTSAPDPVLRPPDGDAIASSTDANPADGLRLDFVTAPDGRWRAARLAGTSLGPFEVPTGGFSAGGRMYTFYTTDHLTEGGREVMGRSVLASATRPEDVFTVHYTMSRRSEEAAGGFKFINVAPWVVNNAAVPGLPATTGQGVLAWGSGRYRASAVHLAWAPVDQIQSRTSWRFWSGVSGATPRWSANEADAAPVVDHRVVGELSVAWCAPLGAWVMMYNAGAAIVARTAAAPWGPWSRPWMVLDPWDDGAYGVYMHAAWPAHPQGPPSDAVCDPGREGTWGGPYGPYIVARHTAGDAREATLHFVLSVWNPYNTMLMRTRLRAGTEAEPVGNPTLIQSRFGTIGRFEVVTARAGGGLTHDRRDNDAAGLPWSPPVTFGSGEVAAVALIESNFGTPGNLEVIARVGDRLALYYWDGALWRGPVPVIADGVEISGVSGAPSLLQSTWGTHGNFELAAPLATGGIGLWFRDNDAPGLPWRSAGVCGGTGRYEAVSLIENRGVKGNLEILARQGDRLVHLWRGGPPSWTWSEPAFVVADGRLVHLWRGGPPSWTWSEP
ncbi:MAG TPA: DUF4185 domain-containing protein, partial [Myxococcota bacterium]|nr:DUF4185 domain-containing protein [Myxococcota bacterium]